MRVGYARVSTGDQTLSLQEDALKKAACERVFKEHASGKNVDRPQLKACLATLRQGDTLVVWRLDRLGRSLQDLISVVREMEGIGVELVSVTEKIDTSSAAGKLTFYIFAVLAEFERNLIRERTLAGLASARARGIKGGAPTKTTATQRKSIRALYRDHSVPIKEITKQFKISKTTLHRIVQGEVSAGVGK